MEEVVRTRRSTGIAVLVAGLLLVTACGKSTTTQAVQTKAPTASSDFTGNPDGPYCRAALQWALVEMAPRDESSPTVEKKYWEDYDAFLKHSRDVAPAEIKQAIGVYTANGIDTVIPIIRKYGYDKKRFESQATAADKKSVETNPPGFDEAFEKIIAYEWQVCGNGTPDAAKNVKFSGEKTSAYCVGAKEGNEAFQKVRESGFDPAVVKAFFTSKKFNDRIAKKESVAPEAIKSDVAADVNWIRTKQVPTLAKWDYDFHKVKLQAPAADRFAIDMSAVEIRDVERRLNAYEGQVCGL
jgi:hypothetical protein